MLVTTEDDDNNNDDVDDDYNNDDVDDVEDSDHYFDDDNWSWWVTTTVKSYHVLNTFHRRHVNVTVVVLPSNWCCDVTSTLQKIALASPYLSLNCLAASSPAATLQSATHTWNK